MDPKNSELVAEMEQIRSQNADGLLVPEEVVEFAEDPNTVLHERFEWDDETAGHQYRLIQARNLIRVVVQFEPNLEQHVHTYVSLESDRQNPGGGYRTMGSVMSAEDTRAELLAQALRELNRVREKYKLLKELANVFDAIDAATAASKRKKKRSSSKKKSPKRPQPSA